jgi:hypothetical protein
VHSTASAYCYFHSVRVVHPVRSKLESGLIKLLDNIKFCLENKTILW